jgi:hypothetical protein
MEPTLRVRSKPALRPLSLAACALATSISASALLAEDTMGFMPPGGKSILIENLEAADGDKFAELAANEATNEEWAELLAKLLPDLGENALETVTAYSAINFPLSPEALAKLGETGDAAEILPADGKELAINNCQQCHSLFSGYLVHDRDVTGWLGIFKSPFHSELPMTEIERETFSHYSAINMPLKFEEVPPEYRF